MTANPGGGDYRPERPGEKHKPQPGFTCPDGLHHWSRCNSIRTPASVAQDATDATETPARTPGGSDTAEARTEAQGCKFSGDSTFCRTHARFAPCHPNEVHIPPERESATDPGMTNLEAELVAARADRDRWIGLWERASNAYIGAQGDLEALRAQVARVEAVCAAKEDAQRRANERYAERNIVDAKSGRVFQGVPILTCREIRAALDGA